MDLVLINKVQIYWKSLLNSEWFFCFYVFSHLIRNTVITMEGGDSEMFLLKRGFKLDGVDSVSPEKMVKDSRTSSVIQQIGRGA